MFRAVPIALALALCAVPGDAKATPFRGSEQRAVKEGKVPPRGKVLAAARGKALDAALDAIREQVQVDPAAVKRVRDQAQSWTGAYRVIAERVADGAISVEVEVEIDVPRVRKAVVLKTAPTVRGVSWGGLDRAEGCPRPNDLGFTDAAVRDTLDQSGVLSKDAQAQVRVALTCEDLGTITHTRLVAARVSVEGTTGGRTPLSRDAVGFGETPAEALTSARAKALSELSSALAERARVDVIVRVKDGGPASRIRRLERALEQSVLGVQGAAVAGIDPDGTVRVDVRGSVDAAGVSSGLGELSFPDFELSRIDVSKEGEVVVELAERDGARSGG